MSTRTARILRLVVACALLLGAEKLAAEAITLATTTATENSGLLTHLLPIVETELGLRVRVRAVDPREALGLGDAGEAHVILLDHKSAEEKFVAQGHGLKRYEVMYSDFVLLGPKNDPARIYGIKQINDSLRKIAMTETAIFLSRGDGSGTHRKELSLWRASGIDVSAAGVDWYRETGSGMGATLNTAASLGAYTLADRATWVSFRNKQHLVVLLEGDRQLRNPFGVILVNPNKHPQVPAWAARQFIDWLLSLAGQDAIAAYQIGGTQLFFPVAGQTDQQ